MSYSYYSEQWLPCPVDDVFAFFADPDNLPALLPAWQHARVDEVSLCPPPTSPTSPDATLTAAGIGTRLTLSFRPFPLAPFRVRWEAKITEFAWNEHFCDLQIRGPFAYWNHCHSLRREDRGGLNATLVVDQVNYKLPFGPLGRLAHGLFLRRQIERTFAFRQRQVAEIFAQLQQTPERPQPQ